MRTYEGILTDGTSVRAEGVRVGDRVDIFPGIESVACLPVVAVHNRVQGEVVITVRSIVTSSTYSHVVPIDAWLPAVWLDLPSGTWSDDYTLDEIETGSGF